MLHESGIRYYTIRSVCNRLLGTSSTFHCLYWFVAILELIESNPPDKLLFSGQNFSVDNYLNGVTDYCGLLWNRKVKYTIVYNEG